MTEWPVKKGTLRSFLSKLSLSTPGQRLGAWLVLTIAIYFARFHWLENLSLFKRIGWDWAPSIGLTRAYWLILHGRFDDALHMNRLIVVVLIIGVPLLIKDAVSLIRHKTAS